MEGDVIMRCLIAIAVILVLCLSAAASSYDDTSKRIGDNKNGKAVHCFIGMASGGVSSFAIRKTKAPEWVKTATPVLVATLVGFAIELFDDSIDPGDVKDYTLSAIPVAVISGRTDKIGAFFKRLYHKVAGAI